LKLRRPRAFPDRATAGVEFFTAAVTAGVVLAGLAHHFLDGGAGQRSYPGEGRRIVAFRQVADRICEENRGNMHRAFDEARNSSQALAYARRALGWDMHDLTSVTPPPTMIEDFLSELATRRHLQADLRRIKLTGKNSHQPLLSLTDDIKAAEVESTEISSKLGLPNCGQVLPHLLWPSLRPVSISADH
jgi:hypothetical protein